jgi:hypothetical protein
VHAQAADGPSNQSPLDDFAVQVHDADLSCLSSSWWRTTMTCGAGWCVARAPWQSACRTSMTTTSGTPAACGRPRRREGRARCHTTCPWAAGRSRDGIGKRWSTCSAKCHRCCTNQKLARWICSWFDDSARCMLIYALVFPPPKFHYTKRRFPITSKCWQMHEVLNVDEIKN